MKNINEELNKIKINVPAMHNKILQQTLDVVNANEEIKALWHVININAIDRLKMTDHGYVHFQIVSNIGIKIARMLKKNNIPLSIEKDIGLSYEHGELVIFLASIMHDLGMTISREGHEEFSLIIAHTLLREILDFLPITERSIVTSEVLHAIISHRKGGMPITIEAGIIRVADALDLSEGRSRIPYEAGDISIHSLSATAIDKVDIKDGTEKIIEVEITMNNSVGVFQVDELLKKKIKGSGLEKYISIRAIIPGEHEKSLIKELVI